MVESFLQSLLSSASSVASSFIPTYILPNLQAIIQVVVLLVVAFIAGKAIKIISVKILTVVGLRKITSQSWAQSLLKAAGYKGSFVELISDLVKWLVYILFLTLIIQTLGLGEVAVFFTSVAGFIPRFIGAILIIAIGFIIADFFGKIFEEASKSFLGEDILSSVAGAAVKYSISLISLIMSLSLLGLDVMALTVMFALLFAGILIVLLMGIKDIFPNYTAGIHIKRLVKPGEFIIIGSNSGVVERVDTFSVILRDGQKRVAIPNVLFLSTPLEKRVK